MIMVLKKIKPEDRAREGENTWPSLPVKGWLMLSQLR
jgi:hypothetical protein